MQKHSNDLQLSKFIQAEDFEYLCFNLTRELMSFDEPIPDYSTRDYELLESSLGAPMITYGGNFLYPTFINQASILFYSLIKNHPFKNGNKRIAVMSLLIFLKLNDKWLKISPKSLYMLALDVAKSKPKDRDQVVKKIEKQIKNNII